MKHIVDKRIGSTYSLEFIFAYLSNFKKINMKNTYFPKKISKNVMTDKQLKFVIRNASFFGSYYIRKKSLSFLWPFLPWRWSNMSIFSCMSYFCMLSPPLLLHMVRSTEYVNLQEQYFFVFTLQCLKTKWRI